MLFRSCILVCFLAVSLSQGALPKHPRLSLPDSDMPAVKDRLAKEDWAKAYLKELQTKYDPTLDQPIHLPDRGGQWFHYYACPIHGVRLRTESPTRHVCPIDGQVFTGYPYDDCVITMVHLQLAEAVRDLGYLYHITGERKYGERARDIALAYADKYLSYAYHDIHNEPKVPGGRVTPQTLDEAIWLIHLAEGVDQIWPILTPPQIQSLKTKLFYPCVRGVILPQHMGIHNIQCWKDSAVGLTGLLFDDSELLKDAVNSTEHGLRAQIHLGVTADGQWDEGSWAYHFYALDAMLPLTEALRICGTDLYTDDLHRMFTAPILMAMPDGRLPAFNDSDTTTADGDPAYEIGLARFHDALLAKPIITANPTTHAPPSRQNLPALLTGVSPLPDPPQERFASENYPASGYAILRSGNTWMCLKYGPHGGGHGHYDKLSFVLYADGKILANDPGNSPYGLPLHNGWHKTTLAHNTISIDQENQRESTGSCPAFIMGKDFSACLLDGGTVYPNAKIKRAAFLLNDSAAVFIDQVTTLDHQPHVIDLAYHPDGKWGNPADNQSWVSVSAPATQPAQSAAYTYLRDLTTLKMTQSLTLPINSPIGTTFITLAQPESATTYFRGTGVGKNITDRVPILIARRSGESATFMWAVTTHAGMKPPILVPQSTTSMQVIFNGKTWQLRADADGADPKIEVHQVANP
ncbi:MAG TPA: heparinase II/III family protein [Tepidisphaeraceae bacterium]|jgi:hypothetical protein|nr:heparinase II/III family protein [Tepidisphaeraceae bacterium]